MLVWVSLKNHFTKIILANLRTHSHASELQLLASGRSNFELKKFSMRTCWLSQKSICTIVYLSLDRTKFQNCSIRSWTRSQRIRAMSSTVSLERGWIVKPLYMKNVRSVYKCHFSYLVAFDRTIQQIYHGRHGELHWTDSCPGSQWLLVMNIEQSVWIREFFMVPDRVSNV